MSDRTELESCVLGVVWLRGPCTAYTVRQEFLRSYSSHWSGSAGAIYPLLTRLEASGLIKARDHAWGSGAKTEFTITRKGLASLQKWIGPPLPQWTAAPTIDPVRTRLSFLAAIPASKRKRFIAAALENLAREIGGLETRLGVESGDDPFEELAVLGALYELQGRQRWLTAVHKRLVTKER